MVCCVHIKQKFLPFDAWICADFPRYQPATIERKQRPFWNSGSFSVAVLGGMLVAIKMRDEDLGWLIKESWFVKEKQLVLLVAFLSLLRQVFVDGDYRVVSILQNGIVAAQDTYSMDSSPTAKHSDEYSRASLWKHHYLIEFIRDFL